MFSTRKNNQVISESKSIQMFRRVTNVKLSSWPSKNNNEREKGPKSNWQTYVWYFSRGNRSFCK